MSKTSTNRGRAAERPQQIPASGWWDIIVRVKSDLTRDNASLVAALSFYGLLFTPADVIRHTHALSSLLPPEVRDIFNSELQDVARRHFAANVVNLRAAGNDPAVVSRRGC